jgi:phosphinothricin acetyltransferase
VDTLTIEKFAPDIDEWARPFEAATAAGLLFVVAELGDRIAGYAYCCSAWKTRPAYRQTVEDSIYVAPWAAGHRKRGLADAGRLRAVGFKHERWLDTVLLQRSLAGAR